MEQDQEKNEGSMENPKHAKRSRPICYLFTNGAAQRCEIQTPTTPPLFPLPTSTVSASRVSLDSL
jgi:hypothetical protein